MAPRELDKTGTRRGGEPEHGNDLRVGVRVQEWDREGERKKVKPMADDVGKGAEEV